MNFLQWARTQWDRVSGCCLIGLGSIAIVLGWLGVSREALTAQQIPYIVSGGIGGLFLLGTGATLWLSADLRDEWRKLDAIERNAAVTEAIQAEPTIEEDPFAVEPRAGESDGSNGDGRASKPRKARPLRPGW